MSRQDTAGYIGFRKLCHRAACMKKAFCAGYGSDVIRVSWSSARDAEIEGMPYVCCVCGREFATGPSVKKSKGA